MMTRYEKVEFLELKVTELEKIKNEIMAFNENNKEGGYTEDTIQYIEEAMSSIFRKIDQIELEGEG